MEMNIFILKKEGVAGKRVAREGLQMLGDFFSSFRYWGGCCLQRIWEFYGVTFRGSVKITLTLG